MQRILKAVKAIPDRLTTELFTFKQLSGMFFPLMLDQFFIYAIGILSMAMVSSTGEAAIAAVSMVGSINMMVVCIFTAIATGGAIVIARAKGASDATELRRAIGETTGLCGALSVALSALLIAFARPLVNALYPNVEQALVDYSVRYMRLMALSFVPYSVFCAIFNTFRSVGDTKSALLLTVVINASHLIFSFVFINLMGLGVNGAGLSYLCARLIGVVLALMWMLKIHNRFGVRVRHFFRFSKSVTREIVHVGVPIGFESILFQGGMLIVQVYLAQLATSHIAAQGIANSVFNLYYITANAVSSIAATVCGQAIGAKKPILAKRYCTSFIRLGRWILLLTVAVVYPLTGLVLKLYSPSPEAEALIRRAVAIAAVCMPILWCDGFVTPMALRAAGDVVYPTVVSLLALAAGRLLLGYLLTIRMGMGMPGIWAGMMLEWLIRAVVLRLRLNGERWTESSNKRKEV